MKKMNIEDLVKDCIQIDQEAFDIHETIEHKYLAKQDAYLKDQGLLEQSEDMYTETQREVLDALWDQYNQDYKTSRDVYYQSIKATIKKFVEAGGNINQEFSPLVIDKYFKHINLEPKDFFGSKLTNITLLQFFLILDEKILEFLCDLGAQPMQPILIEIDEESYEGTILDLILIDILFDEACWCCDQAVNAYTSIYTLMSYVDIQYRKDFLQSAIARILTFNQDLQNSTIEEINNLIDTFQIDIREQDIELNDQDFEAVRDILQKLRDFYIKCLSEQEQHDLPLNIVQYLYVQELKKLKNTLHK